MAGSRSLPLFWAGGQGGGCLSKCELPVCWWWLGKVFFNFISVNEQSVLVTQLSPSLYNPFSLPGFSVHGILQARILEWVAISFSIGSSWTQGSNLGLVHWQADPLLSEPPGKPYERGSEHNEWEIYLSSPTLFYQPDGVICINPRGQGLSPRSCLKLQILLKTQESPSTKPLTQSWWGLFCGSIIEKNNTWLVSFSKICFESGLFFSPKEKLVGLNEPFELQH